ncbi:MAG: MBL fold metallo-hydrolase [Euzebyales bacterium]|nr:MBL fold metallo-hydrolase [Euzebyales bacterium]
MVTDAGRATEVAAGVHRLGFGFVNYYLVEADGGLTMIDAGMRGHWPQLPRLLARLGRRLTDIEAVVLTHAHVDHSGFSDRVRRDARATVMVHTADANPGTRRFPPLHLYGRPSSWPFLVHGLRYGVMLGARVFAPTAFGDGAELDVPGRPRVVHTPGHTRGSCALHLPDRGALVTGDALVTFDPYTRGRGPRLLLDGVNEDPPQARRSLDRLAGIDADVVLPGHGEPWHGGVSAAVDRVREITAP